MVKWSKGRGEGEGVAEAGASRRVETGMEAPPARYKESAILPSNEG